MYFVVGFIPISATTDRGGWGDFVSIMDEVNKQYDSLSVYNGCEASSSNNIVTHTDYYFFFSRKWWDCVKGISPGIELWDDRVITDSWDNKY